VAAASGRIDTWQGLDLPDGVAYKRRAPEERVMSKRMLVVEDQEDLPGVLSDLLTGSGFTVIEAGDGEVGVAEAKSDRPDLIRMDTHMRYRLL
jgi:PleD family two-component response regulator